MQRHGRSEVERKAFELKYKEQQAEYSSRDVILYNLGVGARSDELDFVYENAQHFTALPGFGVIPQFGAVFSIDYNAFLPKFNPMLLLHGEQYLEIHQYPIPTDAKVTIKPEVIEVLDKGKAATVVAAAETWDSRTNKLLFRTEQTIFLRGSGGFGGPNKPRDRGSATAANSPPQREPDLVVEEMVSPQAAVLYRLSGDPNPLHVDPEFAAVGGFKKPILHGLCTFGMAAKHIFLRFGPLKALKVRFTGHVFPGETLIFRFWKDDEKNRVVFQVVVKERNMIAISAAAAELQPSKKIVSKSSL